MKDTKGIIRHRKSEDRHTLTKKKKKGPTDNTEENVR